MQAEESESKWKRERESSETLWDRFLRSLMNIQWNAAIWIKVNRIWKFCTNMK